MSIVIRRRASAVCSTVFTKLAVERLKVKGGDIALYRNPISELRRVTCHMGSHSVTCHPTQVNVPCQIRQNSIYLLRRDGRLSWPRCLVTYRDGLSARRQSPIQVLSWSSV